MMLVDDVDVRAESRCGGGVEREMFSQCRCVTQAAEGAGQCGRVVHRDQQSVDSVLDPLRRPTTACGDDRPPGSEVLQDVLSERFRSY
jgi:hypothetical protein